MMENKIKFAPNVMLIDASYLDRVTCDLQAHFAPIVNRELPKADLAVLLECLALDAGMKLGNNEIQVIFIYESGEGRLEGLTPSDLGKELHGMAFKSELGEFALYAFQPSDLATREELFIESLQLAGEFKEMQCLPVESFLQCGEELEFHQGFAGTFRQSACRYQTCARTGKPVSGAAFRPLGQQDFTD